MLNDTGYNVCPDISDVLEGGVKGKEEGGGGAGEVLWITLRWTQFYEAISSQWRLQPLVWLSTESV